MVRQYQDRVAMVHDEWDKGYEGTEESRRLEREKDTVEGQVTAKKGRADARKNERRNTRRGDGEGGAPSNLGGRDKPPTQRGVVFKTAVGQKFRSGVAAKIVGHNMQPKHLSGDVKSGMAEIAEWYCCQSCGEAATTDSEL